MRLYQGQGKYQKITCGTFEMNWLNLTQFSDTAPTKEKAKNIPGMNNPKNF